MGQQVGCLPALSLFPRELPREFPVGVLVEVRHEYEDGGLSPWKQGVVCQAGPDYVVKIIHTNGVKESVTVWRSNIRAGKLLVRNAIYAQEFEHLQLKAHGQQFCSTSVVSASRYVTFRYRNQAHTFAISIGCETNVVGGSARDVWSGWQSQKSAFQTQEECSGYINNVRLDYMMEDYADLFQYKAAGHVSAEGKQLELVTKLFNEWSCNNCLNHNEVLVNLHPDMIIGIIVEDGSAADVQHVREAFSRAFERQLPVITRRNNFFFVEVSTPSDQF